MSPVIPWIAAEAERTEHGVPSFTGITRVSQKRRDVGHPAGVGHPDLLHPPDFSQEKRGAGHAPGLSPQELPAHQFPARPAQEERAGTEAMEDPEQEQERRIYRRRTVTMLRRYMRYAIETGRLPSLLGREFFRAKVTSYTVVTFEDRVIFVHDMEMCLARLDEFSRRVLSRVVLQEYEQEEAAHLLGCTRMTVHRKLVEALDRLKDILLEVGLLEGIRSGEKNSCQEGERGNFLVSDCEEEK
ncbi:MAG: sigma factor-like helix-turn-helix DNA-binding protein [Candidatus Sulfotelmatobacter sp.]|jgi:DNA-directed RNA polymerase specialized sigma24 family protein